MKDSIRRITFVWNADFSVSGGINALKEVLGGYHSCSLCEIAYHRVAQTSEWKGYRKALQKKYNAEIRQPCRNQLTLDEAKAAIDDYPAVLVYVGDSLVKALGSKEIDACDGDFAKFRRQLDAALENIQAKARI